MDFYDKQNEMTHSEIASTNSMEKVPTMITVILAQKNALTLITRLFGPRRAVARRLRENILSLLFGLWCITAQRCLNTPSASAKGTRPKSRQQSED
jgi:hypothetical protein